MSDSETPDVSIFPLSSSNPPNMDSFNSVNKSLYFRAIYPRVDSDVGKNKKQSVSLSDNDNSCTEIGLILRYSLTSMFMVMLFTIR